MVYNQLNLPFLSPTINLFFSPDDFVFLCLHLEEYINGTMVECTDSGKDYPVGLLSPTTESCLDRVIKIYFMHYNTYEEAFKKWEERKRRINRDNIYIVLTFCYPSYAKYLTSKLIEQWNQIKYKKVVLVDKKYGFDNEFVLKKPSNCNEDVWIFFTPGKVITWRKVFNKFNFIRFLN